MKISRASILVAAAISATVLTACGSSGPSAPTGTAGTSGAESSSTPAGSPSASPAPRSTAAPASTTGAAAESTAELEQYCQQSGGQVQTRRPFWNTNGDQSQWLALAGTATMCRFQADDEAQSRIYVDLTTLSSTDPTLAGLAYLAKVPMPPSSGGANPATGYCGNELRGSSTFGGAGAAGGGWVAQADPDDVVVSLCVFPDGSYIDEWGLAYHSAGDVRGKDLTSVMRYRPAGTLPPVFSVPQVQPTS